MPKKSTKKSKDRDKMIAALYRDEVANEPSQVTAEDETTGFAMESMGSADPGHTPTSSEFAPVAEAGESNYGSLGKGKKVAGIEVEYKPAEAKGAELAESVAAADEELLLDAWYAEFADPATRALIRHQRQQQDVLEVVIGPDDRVRVTATQSYPWRCICSLRITANDGTSWIGTGWLVGPRTVITAGHCIYIHNNGGWARSVEVIPGRNGSNRPYGSATSSALRSVTGWTRDRNTNYDYGAILLPENSAFGNRLGWFGYQNLGDSELNGLRVNVAGYPGDKPAGTHWWHALDIKAVEARKLVYDIDTAGGQSGAPVWVFRNNQRRCVGIHTNGSLAGNRATRINSGVAARIRDWKAEVE